MKKRYLIGTDIGTSGTKSVLTDLNGHIVAEALAEYPLLSPKPLWAEQQADVWEEAVYKTISDVVKQSGVNPAEIGGICISGLFAGSGVPVDEEINPVRPAIIWMDRRAQSEAEYVEQRIGTDRIFRITGNRNDSYFGFAKILWIKNNEPDNWKKIKMFLPSNSYVVYKITGKITIDYTAAANIGGIYDLRKNDWAYDLMEEMGIPDYLMPKDFRYPSEIVGGVTQEAAEKLGVPPGTPVCAGCTDCLASTLAAGALLPGDQVTVIGTSINWGFLHQDFPKKRELVTMPYIFEPNSMYYTYGGASTAGALLKWYKNNFAKYTSDSHGTISKTTYDMLNKAAAEIGPGSDGLIILPYFMAERSPIWDVNAKGTIFGLTLHHQQAHVYRAFLESAAYALRHIIETSGIDTSKYSKCVITGGAAKSLLWKEIFADVTGVTVLSPKSSVQAPVGDALIAGVATGLIDDYSVIKEWIEWEEPVSPDRTNHSVYSQYFQEYKELYRSLKENMKRLESLL